MKITDFFILLYILIRKEIHFFKCFSLFDNNLMIVIGDFYLVIEKRKHLGIDEWDTLISINKPI